MLCFTWTRQENVPKCLKLLITKCHATNSCNEGTCTCFIWWWCCASLYIIHFQCNDTAVLSFLCCFWHTVDGMLTQLWLYRLFFCSGVEDVRSAACSHIERSPARHCLPAVPWSSRCQWLVRQHHPVSELWLLVLLSLCFRCPFSRQDVNYLNVLRKTLVMWFSGFSDLSLLVSG